MKIAIVGAGISGLSAAWALRNSADVTLYEQADDVGGHAHTVTVDYDGTPIPVDIGFIVYNPLNYPNLIAFFEALGVETKPSDMSFAVSDPEGYEWASSARGLFAWKRNLLRPSFHRFWRTILKFNDIARAELAVGKITDSTLGAWLDRHGFDESFQHNYILPMGAAIWSTPEADMLNYPARSFFQFFENHRLMHKERPKWRTVAGGSQQYVRRVADVLGSRIRTDTPVTSVSRFGSKLQVRTNRADPEIYDHVILTCHSDQALGLIEESFDQQSFALRSMRYRPNKGYLHRDSTLMPRRRAAWAAWNVLRQAGDEICLTYNMNKLQGIADRTPLFVTLNPDRAPKSEATFLEFTFSHPQFDLPGEAAVRTIRRENGQDGLWFAGAWMGSGFHEDGLKSGLEVALALGGSVPWEPENLRIPSRLHSVTPASLSPDATRATHDQ